MEKKRYEKKRENIDLAKNCGILVGFYPKHFVFVTFSIIHLIYAQLIIRGLLKKLYFSSVNL